jgi:hypothetical protein
VPVQHINPVIERQARHLAEDNRRAEPDITRVFWFPDDAEVRLVELTDQVPANEDGAVHPFYFRAAPADDLPAPSAIAMIRAAELGQLRLPPQWGNWNDATEL